MTVRLHWYFDKFDKQKVKNPDVAHYEKILDNYDIIMHYQWHSNCLKKL